MRFVSFSIPTFEVWVSVTVSSQTDELMEHIPLSSRYFCTDLQWLAQSSLVRRIRDGSVSRVDLSHLVFDR